MILGLHSWKKTDTANLPAASFARKDGWFKKARTSELEQPSTTASVEDQAVKITREILDRIAGPNPLSSLNIRLWNGEYWRPYAPKPATLVLNRPSALREMLSGCSEVALGEAYLGEAFDVEGDMEAAFELADILAEQTRGWVTHLALGGLLHQLPDAPASPAPIEELEAHLNGTKNSPARDRQAIRFHYDVSNKFYSLWLDPRMVYSCAYFENSETDLEEAQLRKLDLICRKLDLRPGERFLEIGSGWGGLLMHAAEHYGVKADGVTLSQKQLEWTRGLIEQRGLQDRVTVRLIDYRDLKDFGTYDKAASVGMVEHVGRKNLGLYFKHVSMLLKPGGLFLNHGIGSGPVPYLNQSEGFIQHYVFPDSDLVSIGHMLGAAESAQWEIRDVDSLREHYAMTLRHWVWRLEARHDEALREVNEAAYRIWRIYMAGSAHGFKTGSLSVYQTLLAKVDSQGGCDMPLTREVWYASRK